MTAPGADPAARQRDPYLLRKHRKLSPEKVRSNPKIGSISRCGSCHTQAEKGSFRERELRIP